MAIFDDTDQPAKDLRRQPEADQTDPLDLQKTNPKPFISEKPPAISGGELTLSYLCENPKLGLPDKEGPPVSSAGGGDLMLSLEKPRSKGKEIATAAASEEDLWVERDFLQLKGFAGGKRTGVEPADTDVREKKVKIETLNLTLAPPDLSLSLNSVSPLPNALPSAVAVATPVVNPLPPRRTFSATNSEDFAPSFSQSCSIPFSHNPSCSLTRNSSENFDMSRDTDHMWYCGAGEGTNGSVHSRFRPLGDGNSITFSNHGGFPPLNGNGKDNNHNSNSVYKANTLGDDLSVYPSELPAWQGRVHTGTLSSESGRNVMLNRPDRVLKEIVSEPIPIMAEKLQEFNGNSIDAVKECLKSLMDSSVEELNSLQRKLERRSDLTSETLPKAHRLQLEIMVAVKTGGVGFLLPKNRIPTTELVEIFLMTRCKNPGCKSMLPIDDCDCKICLNNKGFCSACMCPICFNFDCALNTCSWVGCDVCSHWCHAICGIKKNLIRPGLSLKGGGGMTEMQFYCPGCDHASEMFGFVKEVFMCCAKDWGLETLMKELDCVRMIFDASQDLEGKELEKKAKEMLTLLGKKQVSPVDACGGMLQFFKYGVSDLSVTGSSSKGKFAAQASQPENMVPRPPAMAINPSKPAFTINSTSSIFDSIDALKSDTNPKPTAIEPQFLWPKDDGFQNLDTVVRLKETEAKLFQRLADEARREMDSYRQIARAKVEKLEEEYASKLAKLCLQEAEERRRKKLEELKFLENSHCDYQNMKRRMQAEIASLLERMEATRKQWV
ncbi:Protein OBERON 3 [Apostasia shenzhenica]|uniref:Protein OBERON 3 n=1 Tax=Apostasia shenzhenica TaxID=1088818 RepID=A0A2I0AKV1_9ASPA|nr:Protein OBERON 3 [Apostasia shenzhenica]